MRVNLNPHSFQEHIMVNHNQLVLRDAWRLFAEYYPKHTLGQCIRMSVLSMEEQEHSVLSTMDGEVAIAYFNEHYTLTKMYLTLDEMADIIIPELCEEDKVYILEANENSLLLLHHSLGRYIRNLFGLWAGKHEPKYDANGVDCSEEHPDAISFAVIKTIQEKLREINQLIQLGSLIQSKV